MGEGRELGWDEQVETGGGGDYPILPEGDYSFTVESFERGRHPGSEKIPPCHKAILKLRIEAPEGCVVLTENLLLYSTLQWKIADFFLSIGAQKGADGKVPTNWNIVSMATGRATIEIQTDRTDASKKYNHVKKFLPKGEKAFKAGEF